jgi:AcrR family transcriptional regulator
VGIEEFSMRLLGERLGSGTATLYRHFAGKDELMVYVVDRIVGEIDAEIDRDAYRGNDWRQATARWAHSLFDVLNRHPNALPLFVSRVPVGPNALAKRERSLALLVDRGFTRELAARCYTAVAHYVVGVALQQQGSGSDAEGDREHLRCYFGSLDAETYPATVAAATELTAVGPSDEFRFGLELMLDGVECERQRGR